MMSLAGWGADDGSPLEIKGCRGPFLLESRRGDLLDCWCGGGTFALGHRPPAVMEALERSLGRWDIGNHHLISAPRGALGRMLSEALPTGLSKTVYNVSGGEAVDVAVKIARGYTGRIKVVSVENACYGGTGFSLAAGSPEYARGIAGLAPGFVRVPFGDMGALRQAIDGETAAFLVEPIGVSAGVLLPPEGYLNEAAKLCGDHRALLIADEASTGLWRTGNVLACEGLGIVPDIVIVGRALSGGVYPIHATCFRKKLDRFFRKHPFIHVSTCGGTELGCMVAQAALRELASEAVQENARARAIQLGCVLDELSGRHGGLVTAVRQRGMLAGIETASGSLARRIREALLEDGVYCRTADLAPETLLLFPPLSISAELIDRLGQALHGALRRTRIVMT